MLKEDVVAFVASQKSSPAAPATSPKPTSAVPTAAPARRPATSSLITDGPAHRAEEVKPMSMLRRTIAARLVEAQKTAALLTTFNEIDMEPVMSIRKKYATRSNELPKTKIQLFLPWFASLG